MSKYKKLALLAVSLVSVILIITLLTRGSSIDVLMPRGKIAQEQFDLIMLTCLLSLIVVVPVFVMLFYIARKYRAGNKNAKYSPHMHGSNWAELVWWGIPLLLIIVLSVIIWTTSHRLDPYRPIDSSVKPVTVQVVALNWKWLFIYPEQKIATVNLVQFPEDTPVNFEITADAPMNSFWVPQLGGQVYAMAGMKTKLHLIADKPGEYKGVSANLSGEGFAGMKFTAKSTSRSDFDDWVQWVKQASKPLDMDAYRVLAKPSSNNPAAYYTTPKPGLFDTIMMKYMMPGADADSSDKTHDGASDGANTHYDAGNPYEGH
jgi:cytochrome o ubiquinol oxidase subunit II